MPDDNKCKSCNDDTCTAQLKRPGEGEQDFLERQALASRMCQIEHKIMVLSGKGGVGKSTVAVNIATALAIQKKRVGILDIDIHGPSVPKLLHIEDAPIFGDGSSLDPVQVAMRPGLLNVMSIGFLLPDKSEPVIWRGPRKYGAIKQFLKDVQWGKLDYLIVDSPPGTGDEPLAVVQLIGDADGAVVVSTPQELAVQDVRKCVVFCHQLQLKVLGVVENMSGFICPKCGEHTPIFGAEGGRKMAKEMGVPFLDSIPIESLVVASGDSGKPVVQAYPNSETAKAFSRIVWKLMESKCDATQAYSAQL